MKEEFVSEALGEHHLTSGFDCGRIELNEWLEQSALHAQRHRTARSFIWHRGDDVALAYFSLAAHLLERASLPRALGHGSPEQIPAVLIARLALDKSLHAHVLGSELLADALTRTVTASANVTVRFVVVDAVDNHAAAFYSAHGFRSIPADPLRLVRKLSSIAQDVSAPL